ncbi:solute carrier family 5 (high affinity choline transporter), member 7 [Fistulifera solaris]|uniref:Solute carrier family 5 (High affinity choline transporter), member 7 n=1 Tax=Fistulifera solaris TaxID=1519565 RepID=A0A1Z5JY65_FISSO|nr:solute carrier family 5 (high affinity choline transporter), member 7 [Fistulifera solaris]|eukprot:GAX18701.1 solute carrier family 5 (high affinity choline transporter), member 7 [Fistulifera solaris]
MRPFLLAALTGVFCAAKVAADCIADPDLNAEFEAIVGGPIPAADSCCQNDVCAIPCPEPVSDPSVGFAIAVGASIILSFAIGVLSYFFVDGEAENYFVAGHSLPLWIVAMTLGAQSIDSNTLLGNVDLSYKYHFYDGACIPIGLGCSLILNALLFARKMNAEKALTLPDVLARRYGKIVELLVSGATLCSFLMLLAGNLVGIGVITAYVWNISDTVAIWLAAAIVWAYTVSGGLFSVAYTDVVQGVFGWSGCIIVAYWFIANAEQNSPPVSIGFPGYVYPDEASCQMYDGVPCTNVDGCCYNAAKWCDVNGENCRADNGAYPFGDRPVFSNQMTDPQALTPFPNAIFWNWCTIFILTVGNIGALDFQVRCMAANSPRTAQIGCFIGGLFTFFIGVPFGYLGAITRYYYGPDSVHAEFEADSCSEILGLPTCGAWLPDDKAFIKLLTHEAPPFLGAWGLIGIVAASMSTADGAILAMGTVFSHNVLRQLDAFIPGLITRENLLLAARLATVPFTITSACIASFYKSSDSAAGATGYLLIVAFDIVLATVVPAIFACFYVNNPSPRAALCSILTGATARIVLEFVLPKDGLLLLPFNKPEFYDYGTAASSLFPPFFDENVTNLWDPAVEPCVQEQFKDYTGVDSVAAFVGSVIVFALVQMLENSMGEPLFTLSWLEPYDKDITMEGEEEASKQIDETQKTKQSDSNE